MLRRFSTQVLASKHAQNTIIKQIDQAKTMGEMRTLYYSQQAKFKDYDYIEAVRRCISIIEQQQDTDSALVQKLQTRLLTRIPGLSGKQSLNVLRMVSQGMKAHLQWSDFYNECVQSVPREIVPELSLETLISYSINYFQVLYNKQMNLIPNERLEQQLSLAFQSKLPQIVSDLNDDDFITAVRMIANLKDKSSFKQLLPKCKQRKLSLKQQMNVMLSCDKLKMKDDDLLMFCAKELQNMDYDQLALYLQLASSNSKYSQRVIQELENRQDVKQVMTSQQMIRIMWLLQQGPHTSAKLCKAFEYLFTQNLPMLNGIYLQHVLQICHHPKNWFPQLKQQVTQTVLQKLPNFTVETQMLVWLILGTKVEPNLDMSFDEINMCLQTGPKFDLEESIAEIETLMDPQEVVATQKGQVFSVWLLRLYTWLYKSCELEIPNWKAYAGMIQDKASKQRLTTVQKQMLSEVSKYSARMHKCPMEIEIIPRKPLQVVSQRLKDAFLKEDSKCSFDQSIGGVDYNIFVPSTNTALIVPINTTEQADHNRFLLHAGYQLRTTQERLLPCFNQAKLSIVDQATLGRQGIQLKLYRK